MVLVLHFLALCLTLVAAVRGASIYPMPLPCTGEACTQFTVISQDFIVLQHQNGTWFRISKDNGLGPRGSSGLVVATAPHIRGPWTLQQPIFPANVKLVGINATERQALDLWAPDVRTFGGLYYLYYSVYDRNQKSGAFDIRVATSPTMGNNAWTDHGTIGIPLPATHIYSRIGPSVLSDFDSNEPYAIAPQRQIVWGSYASALYGMHIDPNNATKVVASQQPYPLIEDQYTNSSPQSVMQTGGYNRTEASFNVHMHGYYYYFFSRGDCCGSNISYAYTTAVCRSKSAAGPYVDAMHRTCTGNPYGPKNHWGTVILESHSLDAQGNYSVFSPGSVSMAKVNGSNVITYQYANQSSTVPRVSGSYSFGWNYLKMNATYWPYLSETP